MPGHHDSRTLAAQLRKEHYTPAEVAALFGVEVATVSMWRRRGKITGSELPGGRRWIYPRAGIDALAARRRQERRERG